MTIDDAPMDELDLAIRREAALLRTQTEATALTDDAWDDFLQSPAAPVVPLRRTAGIRRGRWRIAAAIGMAAALIATVVIVRQLLDDDPTKLPIVTPSPSTTTLATPNNASYAAVTIGRDDELIAVSADNTKRVIGTVPSDVLAGMRGPTFNQLFVPDLAVSAVGWVAASSSGDTGYWFFDLHDPDGSVRFASLSGGSVGTWNPQGTLFAAVRSDGTVVVFDPTTGQGTELDTTNASTVDSVQTPTWTADGSGILTRGQGVRCATDSVRFGVLPVDGGPELPVVPDLADGMNRVAAGGTWMLENRCATVDENADSFPNVVVIEGSRRDDWVDTSDVAPAALRSSVFASTRDSLWVLATSEGTATQAFLYDVRSPHDAQLANSVELEPGDIESPRIAGVAPDDSAVVMGRISSHVTVAALPTYEFVPTDGSGPVALGRVFAGFVPMALVEELDNG